MTLTFLAELIMKVQGLIRVDEKETKTDFRSKKSHSKDSVVISTTKVKNKT